MPKKDPVESLNVVSVFLTELGESMSLLSDAVRDDSEEEIDEIVNGLPTKREITKNLTLLGSLLETQPWKKGKKNA
jgi:hypothetical protein